MSRLLARLLVRLLRTSELQEELRKAVTATQAESTPAALSNTEALRQIQFGGVTITSPEFLSLQDRLKARQCQEISLPDSV